VTVGAHPGIVPRLVRPELHAREDLDAYRAVGGYGSGLAGDALVDAVEAAGLRGRGGAAFPAAVKWRAVAGGRSPRSIAANGEEGEPRSHKDRYLLRRRPHLVLDGLLRAAVAIRAERAYVYLSDAEAEESVALALDELDAVGGTGLPVELVRVEHAYVAGEETALVRAIEGGPALPLAKPPRPFEAGIRGGPTLVQNVETLANVPFVAIEGPERYRDHGTDGSPGTFLLSASGACGAPGVYELPFGLTLEDAFATVAGGFSGRPAGFLMGGYFAGVLGPRGADLRLDYDELRAAGSGLGCGAVTALDACSCPVVATAAVSAYFAGESARQCGVCRNGTAAMAEALERLCRQEPDPDDLDRLEGWSVRLPGRGACGFLDGAAGLVGSLLREFPEEVEAHAAGDCPRCATARVPVATTSEGWMG
jgi:NADH:ubiquinone oxidoreductase subunit F (NADH-binding)